jgi:hypothetical protein
VLSKGAQEPFRQLADQIDPTCGELTLPDPRQTRFDKMPSLFAHELPGVRREQDVLTLHYGNECLRGTHRSDSCPTALAPDNGR